jgi:MFS family permease
MKHPEVQKFMTKYWLLSAMDGMSFLLPYLVIILNQSITPTQVALVLGVKSIVQFSLEIPTGALADRFSRKNVLLAGQLSIILGFVILLFDKSFTACLISMALWGLCDTLFSGTDQSFYYDNMKYYKIEKKYPRYEMIKTGLFTAVCSISVFFAAFLLKYYDFDTLILLQIIALIVYFIILASIKDYSHTKLQHLNKKYFKILKQSFKYILKHSTVFKINLFFFFHHSIWVVLINYDGLFVRSISNNNSMPGIVTGINTLICTLITFTFVKKLAARSVSSLMFQMFIGAISLFISYALYSFPTSIIFTTGFWSITLTAWQVMRAKFQIFIPSKLRATINSVMSMTANCIQILWLMLFGYIAGEFSNRLGFFMLGSINLIVCLVFLFVFAKDKHIAKRDKF